MPDRMFNNNRQSKDSSNKKRICLFWLLIGIVAGILLALPAKLFLLGHQNQTADSKSGVHSEIRRLDTDVLLSQAEDELGFLTEGTRIVYKPDNKNGQQFQLWLEWERDGTFDEVFLPVTDKDISTERKAVVTLEKREQ